MKDLILKLSDAYALALNCAEQGGLFSAINFRNRFPTAQAWYASLPEERRRDITID